MAARYDTIGKGYATQRRTEPRWARQIHDALDGAVSIVNVGAGTGSYEPATGVLAVEPSEKMIAQRSPRTSCVRAVAEALPCADNSFDAAMAVLTLHHWSDVAAGLGELRRVADRQVIFLFESLLVHSFWLLEYFPEVLDNEIEQNAPSVADVEEHLNVIDVQTLWIPEDCVDGVAAAYWKRPERYLRPEVQASMSALALLPDEARLAGTTRLRQDLNDGSWARKNSHLAEVSASDYGYRLVIAKG